METFSLDFTSGVVTEQKILENRGTPLFSSYSRIMRIPFQKIGTKS